MPGKGLMCFQTFGKIMSRKKQNQKAIQEDLPVYAEMEKGKKLLVIIIILNFIL